MSISTVSCQNSPIFNVIIMSAVDILRHNDAILKFNDLFFCCECSVRDNVYTRIYVFVYDLFNDAGSEWYYV